MERLSQNSRRSDQQKRRAAEISAGAMTCDPIAWGMALVLILIAPLLGSGRPDRLLQRRRRDRRCWARAPRRIQRVADDRRLGTAGRCDPTLAAPVSG